MFVKVCRENDLKNAEGNRTWYDLDQTSIEIVSRLGLFVFVRLFWLVFVSEIVVQDDKCLAPVLILLNNQS